MQKTVRKKIYDTDTATLLGTITSGLFGDPAGYEERLYQTPEGSYFLYGLGGDASPYPKETIKPASAATAEKWRPRICNKSKPRRRNFTFSDGFSPIC